MRFDAKTVERRVRAKLDDWRGLLTRKVEDGRQLLREALVGPLRFTADGRQYRFAGEVPIERLLSGVVGVPTFVASPGGTHRRWKVWGHTGG
jgi:hypothetical protein